MVTIERPKATLDLPLWGWLKPAALGCPLVFALFLTHSFVRLCLHKLLLGLKVQGAQGPGEGVFLLDFHSPFLVVPQTQ